MLKNAIHQIKKILQQLRKRPHEILSLDLSQINIYEINGDLNKKLTQMHSLISLLMIQCNLNNISNMPQIKNLQFIDLTGNKITDNQIHHLQKYKKLKNLNLASNNIRQIQTLNVFKAFRYLEHLELNWNQITDHQCYQQTAFQILPNLLELDGFDRNGNLISDVSDYEEDEIVEEEQPYGDDDGDNKERQVEVNHFMSSQSGSDSQQMIPKHKPLRGRRPLHKRGR